MVKTSYKGRSKLWKMRPLLFKKNSKRRSSSVAAQGYRRYAQKKYKRIAKSRTALVKAALSRFFNRKLPKALGEIVKSYL